MVIDYIPQRKYPTLKKGAMWALKGATLLVLVGLYEFETNDVGITEGLCSFRLASICVGWVWVSLADAGCGDGCSGQKGLEGVVCCWVSVGFGIH